MTKVIGDTPRSNQASGSRAKYAARAFLSLEPLQVVILHSIPVGVTLLGGCISTRMGESESISSAVMAKKIMGGRWNGVEKRMDPEYPELVFPVPP